jgi:hypothetical protein
VEPSAAAIQQWQTFAEQLYPMIRGSLVPPDLFDEVRRLSAEYRAAHPASPARRP